jgi:signal transduction histidine kinase
LGGILFYQLFKVIIDNDINNKLHNRKEYNLKQLERSDSVILFQNYSANMVSIKQIPSFRNETDVFSDTTIYDRIEGKSIRYRQLSFNATIKNKAYAICVRRSMIEHKELIEGVVLLEILLFVAFVIVLTLVNNKVSKNIWAPFYFILDNINNYKVDSAQSVSLPRNSINEFNELSAAIEKMSAKIQNEFNVQKEFTENASHEIQTPLAIISNKLEILLQSPTLTKEQMDMINSASVAAKRLSKLNEALVILSKIENRQFHQVENIEVGKLIEESLARFSELIQIKSIAIEKLDHEHMSIKMHPYLAEMLVENLLINAIKHNISPGKILISIKNDTLEIANTGATPALGTEKLFQRFVKTNSNSNSLGLGLSIVKAICETYLFSVDYSAKNGFHRVAVHFTQ